MRTQCAQSKCRDVIPRTSPSRIPSATKLKPRLFWRSSNFFFVKTPFWARNIRMIATTESSVCCTQPSSDVTEWGFKEPSNSWSSDDLKITFEHKGQGKIPDAPLNSNRDFNAASSASTIATRATTKRVTPARATPILNGSKVFKRWCTMMVSETSFTMCVLTTQSVCQPNSAAKHVAPHSTIDQ